MAPIALTDCRQAGGFMLEKRLGDIYVYKFDFKRFGKCHINKNILKAANILLPKQQVLK